MAAPPTIHATTTGHGPNRALSILESSAAPTTADGRKAITSTIRRCSPSSSRPKSPRIIWRNRFQNSPTTARIAPNWIATT